MGWVAGNSVSPLHSRSTEDGRWGISSHVLSRRETERSAWEFHACLPHKGKQVGGQVLGEEKVILSPLPQHWEGVGRAVPSGQMDHLLPLLQPCPSQPQVSQLISEKPKYCHQCLSCRQSTAPSPLSPASPQEPDCREDKSDATNREGKKNTFNYIYLYLHLHIYIPSHY